jgi:hypothetical protein
MAELTIETLPPAGPDYPLGEEVSAPAAAPEVQRTCSSVAPSAPRPRVPSEGPGRRLTREDEAP